MEILLLLRVPSVTNRIDGVCAAGVWVPSSAGHGGFRIQSCFTCGIGHNSGLDSVPGLGTPCAVGWPKKKTIKNQKTKTNYSNQQSCNFLMLTLLLIVFLPPNQSVLSYP